MQIKHRAQLGQQKPRETFTTGVFPGQWSHWWQGGREAKQLMVRWPRGQGRKPPLGWSRGAPGGTDRSWCHRGDRVTGRKCPRQRGENGPQLPALLQAPHSASAGHAGAGRWPRPADPAVGNREEQGRAGPRPSCSQESQGSRGGVRHRRRRAASGGAGKVHPEANNSRSPSLAQEEMPWAARAKGLILRWAVASGARTPGQSQPSPSYRPLASDSRSGGQDLRCSDLLLRAVPQTPALSLWTRYDTVHRSRVVPAASSQWASRAGAQTQAGLVCTLTGDLGSRTPHWPDQNFLRTAQQVGVFPTTQTSLLSLVWGFSWPSPVPPLDPSWVFPSIVSGMSASASASASWRTRANTPRLPRLPWTVA